MNPQALPMLETSGEARYRQCERRYRQCERKKMYPDQATADRGADAMRQRSHKSQHFNAYQCDHCHGWHVGRQRTREQGIRRAQKQGAPLA